MKRTLLMIFLMMILCANFTYAGISVCEGGNGRINQTSLRGNPIEGCFYYDSGQNVTAKEYDDVRTLLQTVEKKYLKIENGFPVEMSDVEKTFLDDAIVQSQKQQEITRIVQGDVTGEEILKAIPAILADSENYKELTEEAIKDKIQEQAGLK